MRNIAAFASSIGPALLVWGCGDQISRRKGSETNISVCNERGVGECFDPAPTIRFKELYESFTNDLPNPFLPYEDRPYCDVGTIDIEGHGVVHFNSDPFARGGSSVLFRSRETLNGKYLVAKTVDLRRLEVLKSLANEKAVLTVLNGHGAPAIYKIKKDEIFIPKICEHAILVSEFLGEKPIIAAGRALAQNLVLLARTAVAAISLIKRVHEMGFVHGDIHFYNFVYSGLDDESIPDTTRLIDFERAASFVTPEGRHIPECKREYSSRFNPEILSPFELEGWCKTRRDDIFRLAEMLLEPFANTDPPSQDGDEGGLAPDKQDSKDFLISEKRGKKFSAATPQVFKDFYTFALGLGFSTRPDYELWMKRFSAFKI